MLNLDCLASCQHVRPFYSIFISCLASTKQQEHVFSLIEYKKDGIRCQPKGFYLDLTRCTSCYACVVACKAHHPFLDEAVYWRRVITLEKGTYPVVHLTNLSLSCMHCGTPACKVVCPTKAISKQTEDGLVLVNPDLCIGCKMCLMACPFGIPQFGKNGKMQKCDLCLDRLETGLTPACMNVCPAKALHAGPMDELSSLANRKAATRLIRTTDPSFFI